MSHALIRRFGLALITGALLLSQATYAMGTKRLEISDQGLRLAKDEVAYKLFVTESGEVFAASASDGAGAQQWIRHRDSHGKWRTILSRPTSPSESWGYYERRQVQALWHSGPRIDADHPLWVAWKEPRALVIRSWDGTIWREHKRQGVENGWFMGFAGLGPDLVWVYGKSWLTHAGSQPDDSALDFAWLWDGSRWTETQGDLASSGGGQGMEAMQVISRDEAYAIQNWDFRRWDGETWKRVPSPFEGIGGVKSIGDHFVIASAMVGAYGSRIVAWNPRGGEPQVLSTHPLYANGGTEPSAGDWISGTSLSDLRMSSIVIRTIPGCSGSWPWGNADRCVRHDYYNLSWNGSTWTRSENNPSMAAYLKAGLATQWPLSGGSAWIGGWGFVDRI